jgi:hypothetical protein
VKQLGTLVWIAAAAAACGQVKDGTPDAPDVTPDGPPAPVKVTVLTYAADGAPDTTAKMIYQDAMGRVVSEGSVDAMGKAEAMVPSGGTVTEVRIVTDTPTQLTAQITSIVGVEPGDDLTFGVKQRATVTNQGGQTSMSANYTPFPGATNHVFYTTCGAVGAGTTTPVTLTFRDSCHGATFDLVGITSGVTPPRYVRLTGVNHQNGQAFTIPGGFLAMSNFTVNALNVPTEVSAMTARRASMIEHAAVADQALGLGDPGAGTVTALVPYAPNVGSRAEVLLSFSRSDVPGTQTHAVHTQAISSSIDIDLDRQKVPWITPQGTLLTGASWTTTVPGDMPDGMVMIWSAGWTDGIRNVNVAWRIAFAPSATGMTLPRLSPTHSAVDPRAQTVPVTVNGGTLSVVNYDVVEGYPQFRQQPDNLMFTTVDDMNAFLGMPFQRRLYQVIVPAQP